MASSIASKIGKMFQSWLPTGAEKDAAGNWYYYINDTSKGVRNVERFYAKDAYMLAHNLSEIFFPIDAIADRAASIPYVVVDGNNQLKDPPKNVQRLLSKPNMLGSLQSLLYDLIFAELSTGNSYLYAKVPTHFSSESYSPEAVTSLWSLRPDCVTVNTKMYRPNVFDAQNISDLIQSYVYTLFDSNVIEPFAIAHERLLQPTDARYGYISDTPLKAVQRNIDNLLATYAARWKIYVNNGSAGILTRRPVSGDAVQQAVDPVTRENIIEDITNRNGLTGDKRPWTVSAIPLDFIKTLASINELEPFVETLADANQIAGIYGVDTILLPTGSDSTYVNKEIAERNLWQNVIIGVAKNKAQQLTQALHLQQIGLQITPDFSAIGALKEDKLKEREGDKLTIENCITLLNAGLIADVDVKIIVEKIVNTYQKN